MDKYHTIRGICQGTRLLSGYLTTPNRAKPDKRKGLPYGRVSETSGGAYWTRTSDPIDVNDVLYQLSQSTKDLCEPILAFCPPRHIHGALRIGSSVMYISQYVLPTEPKHQGLPPDALHRKQHLLYSYPGRLSRPAAGKFSVIRLAGGKGAWDGVCPPPHAFAAQLTRAFLRPHPRISLHEHLLFSTRAPSRLRARGQALRERLAASAHAPSCARACGQALRERFAVQRTRTFLRPRP